MLWVVKAILRVEKRDELFTMYLITLAVEEDDRPFLMTESLEGSLRRED